MIGLQFKIFLKIIIMSDEKIMPTVFYQEKTKAAISLIDKCTNSIIQNLTKVNELQKAYSHLDESMRNFKSKTPAYLSYREDRQKVKIQINEVVLKIDLNQRSIKTLENFIITQNFNF